MVRKLQYKFIAISTLAILIVMTSLVALINQQFYSNAFRDIYDAMDFIARHDGELTNDYGSRKFKINGRMVAELRFQLRYFTVWVGEEDVIDDVNLDHINSVSEEEAEEYTKKVLTFSRERGRLTGNQSSYCYLVSDKDQDKVIVFMDYTKELKNIRDLRRFSIWLSLACLCFFILVVTFLSRRAIEPVIRNMENQKRFITNAGHELKTPLAIISANTEVLEMMEGENEWTRSTMNQVQRLTDLVNKLVTLARLGEQQEEKAAVVDLSACVADTVSDFGPVADRLSITLETSIEPDLRITGVESHVKELLNILCDNAVKYCDEGGKVLVSLASASGRAHGKRITLTVSNSYQDGEHVDLSRFFERFYRQDSSHSNEKAGHGIGLAMAEGFVEELKGKIAVRYRDGMIHFRVDF
ncbi:MAG: GHKL domain-containing protein [Eubacterium sp.]|nr:GHKL domain-containing protein [Eubacterium sp.]